MKRIKGFVDWLIARPWLYAAFFLLSPFITDKIKSNRAFSLVYLSISLLLIYRLLKLKLNKIRTQDSNK